MSDLLNHNVLVISQKPKFVEMTNEYEITDENGGELGVSGRRGSRRPRKLLRLVTSVDQFLTHKLAVYDADGQKVLELVRPAKVFKSTLEVVDGQGTRVGRSSRRTSWARSGSGSRGRRRRPSDRSTRRTGGPGTSRSTTRRKRDRPDHEEVGGDPARGVHDRRPLPAEHLRGGRGRPSQAHGRLRGGDRHRPEAGRHGRVRLRRDRPRHLGRAVSSSPDRSSRRVRKVIADSHPHRALAPAARGDRRT